VKVDITLPSKEVVDGDVLFNNEYLITSLVCENVSEDVIYHVDYNVYVDGVRVSEEGSA
jgi:hypothetical protein